VFNPNWPAGPKTIFSLFLEQFWSKIEEKASKYQKFSKFLPQVALKIRPLPTKPSQAILKQKN
jgi:hypothetical protein